jgi:hypothetical protein
MMPCDPHFTSMPSVREEKVSSAGPDIGPYVMIAHGASMFEVATPSPVEVAPLVDQHSLAVRGGES